MGEYSISVSVSRPFTARDAGVSHGQASVMESGDENEMGETRDLVCEATVSKQSK